METVGPSATVPGIVADIEPRPAFAHKQSGVWGKKQQVQRMNESKTPDERGEERRKGDPAVAEYSRW